MHYLNELITSEPYGMAMTHEQRESRWPERCKKACAEVDRLRADLLSSRADTQRLTEWNNKAILELDRLRAIEKAANMGLERAADAEGKLRTDLERVTQEKNEAKGPSFVEDPSSTADTGERIALNAAMLRLFKGQYRDPGDRHSDALFVQDGLVVTQEEVDSLRATIARLTADLAEAKRPTKCPQCGDAVIQDRTGDYCENCGWPDEDRPDDLTDRILSAVLEVVSPEGSDPEEQAQLRAAIDAARDAGKGIDIP